VHGDGCVCGSGSTSSMGGPTLTSGVAGPGGWKRRLYRNSGELGAFGIDDWLEADVMVRLSKVPVRRLTGVTVHGGVCCGTARKSVGGVEGQSVGTWKVGDVSGEGEDALPVVSESGSAK